MSNIFRVLILCFAAVCTGCLAKKNDTKILRENIDSIIRDKNATVGISIIGDSDTLSWNGTLHCPMQSVFKFHIALTVLSEIDKGKFALNQVIQVKKSQLLPENIWSPLRDKYPNGGSFTIAQLIQYAIIESDNVACDVLIALVGTPKTIQTYIQSTGIRDIEITFNEQTMQANWENMFRNWTTPKAATETLKRFYENKNNLLSKNCHQFLWQTMIETTTGPNRLKGLLPDNVTVAHKTGSSGTNAAGITAATNDIGIIFLPNERFIIISIFVTNSRENEQTNERIIAEIAAAVYKHFSQPIQ